MIPIPTTTTTKELLKDETRRTVDLKRLIRTLDAVVTDAPVTIGEDGIRFRAAEASMVALIDLKLKPRFFNRYNFSHPERVQFGLDVSELKNRVCEARKGDAIELEVTEKPGYGNTDHLVHVTVDETGVQSRFTIEPHNLDEEDVPETDDLQFIGSAVVSLDKLKDAIQRMGDSAELTLTGDRLTVESETETGEASVEFLEESDYIHGIQLENGPVSSTYSTDYLEQVTKLKNTVKRVNIRFGNDFPLRVEVDRDQFKLVYTLAPRIEE